MKQTLDIADALQLQLTLEQRQHLVMQIKTLTAELDPLNDYIKAEMIRLGVDVIDEFDNWTPTLTVKERKTLDKVELVQQGVTTAQIERATKVSTYVQLDVRAKKVAG
jgi:hypothetical protein